MVSTNELPYPHLPDQSLGCVLAVTITFLVYLTTLYMLHTLLLHSSHYYLYSEGITTSDRKHQKQFKTMCKVAR